jgi:hypothetical protein
MQKLPRRLCALRERLFICVIRRQLTRQLVHQHVVVRRQLIVPACQDGTVGEEVRASMRVAEFNPGESPADG